MDFQDFARLAAVIGEVVDSAQAWFIPGKFLADNILLATELMKGYTHKFISPRCMIKVDLRILGMELPFLQTMLYELGWCICGLDHGVCAICFLLHSY